MIQVSSEGRHSVRISGLSTIDFRAGFSKKPTLDFKKTLSRPVQGQWGHPFQIVKNREGHHSCCMFSPSPVVFTYALKLWSGKEYSMLSVMWIFQVFPPTSCWTPLDCPLPLGRTGWSSCQSRVKSLKHCRSASTLIASRKACGTSQSSFRQTQPSSCGWLDTTRMVTCSKECPAFLTPVSYLVSDGDPYLPH